MSANLVRAMWLQAIMSRRLVTDKESKAIYYQACKTVGTGTEKYREDITTIQQSLSNIGLELRQMQDEIDGRNMVGVINGRGDQLAQAGTAYTPTELVYIKALIEAIYTAPRSAYSISSMEALSLGVDSNMTKKTREELLANLVRHDWLRKSKGGRYALGTRALMELQMYLKHEYEDNALQCFICNDLITMGLVCATDTPEMSCSVQVHFHCEPRFKSRANANKMPGKCLECKQDWTPWPFGLQATEAVARQSQAFGAGEDGGAGTGDLLEQAGGAADEQEEEENNFDDVEDTQPTTRRQRQSRAASGSSASAKKRGKKRARDSDEEEEVAANTTTSSSRRSTRSRRKSANAANVRLAGGLELDDDDDDDDDDE
ncbi:hypothetical protein OC844_005048 [Tilletia horrida]|nr:hypothetical protein OC844_005048 [Tilletia horrida]